jgi:TPR repeat protein
MRDADIQIHPVDRFDLDQHMFTQDFSAVGIAADPTRALGWYQRAAERGSELSGNLGDDV